MIIHSLAYGALVVTAGATYLQLNKVWSRKHLPEVAASLSIPGMLLEGLPLIFYAVYYLSKAEWLGLIDIIIWLLSTVAWILVATGFWVKGERKKGFWQLLKSSIRRERAELGTLAHELLHPSSGSQLIGVLTAMAAVDGHIDHREIELIQPFADQWNLDIDWDHIAEDHTTSGRVVSVKAAATTYLDTTPLHAQAAHLRDVLKLLIEADETYSEEEQLAFAEVSAQINHYLADGELVEPFSVLIAPQSTEQEESLQLLIKDIEQHVFAGGKGYTVGSYFSSDYADIICSEYRNLGFFTVVTDTGSLQGVLTT